MTVMTVCVCIINIFFIPFIPLLIFYRRNPQKRTSSLHFVLHYGVMCVLNLILTHIFVRILRMVANLDISADEVMYTLISVIASLILICFIEVFRTYFSVRLEIKKKEA